MVDGEVQQQNKTLKLDTRRTYPPASKSLDRCLLRIGNVKRIREMVLGRGVEMGGGGVQVSVMVELHGNRGMIISSSRHDERWQWRQTNKNSN